MQQQPRISLIFIVLLDRRITNIKFNSVSSFLVILSSQTFKEKLTTDIKLMPFSTEFGVCGLSLATLITRTSSVFLRKRIGVIQCCVTITLTYYQCSSLWFFKAVSQVHQQTVAYLCCSTIIPKYCLRHWTLTSFHQHRCRKLLSSD